VRSKVDELARALGTIERIVARGQREGVFRNDLDPGLAAWIFYGAIEEILAGWVVGRLADGDDQVAAAERTVVDVLCQGIAVQ
jgi:hypothetical protein